MKLQNYRYQYSTMADCYKIDEEQAFHKNPLHHHCHDKRNSELSMSIYKEHYLYEISH